MAVNLSNQALVAGAGEASSRLVAPREEVRDALLDAVDVLVRRFGYRKTSVEDIAREAGLGHGTFYLHYPDKRACFLAFVEEARQELDIHVQARLAPDMTLEERIAATLNAIYDYADAHPGVLKAAMTDETVIDADGDETRPLLMRWGDEWARMVRDSAAAGLACPSYQAEIIGQAIVGALARSGRNSASTCPAVSVGSSRLTASCASPSEAKV